MSTRGLNVFLFSIFCSFFIAENAICQDIHKYVFYFADKEQQLKTFNPELYFSKRAIDRRKKNNADFNDLDLPVSTSNLENLENLGLKIIGVSRWKNCAIVQSEDSLNLSTYELYNWIDSVDCIYRGGYPKSTKSRILSSQTHPKIKFRKKFFKKINYGESADQAYMLNVDYLHNRNEFGKNIHIAIFDGGFSNVDKIEAFAHLFKNNQILKTWDFVSNESEVYGDGDHGTCVLSCMAGYVKNRFLGNAPKASFYLFRTEDGRTETITEEFNWLMAAEFADSAGVDVVNSSLGYTTFDKNQPVNYSYNYQKLDGKTGIASFAANQLSLRGVAVCNSAGNSGNDSWTFIGVPADANGIFSVGAVDRDLQKASFSSFGPTADGRIKPDISALGLSSCVIGSDGKVSYSSGTSFSSPIFCGALACFIGANYNVPLQSIYEAVIKTASQSKNPDNSLGYGIPNLESAFKFLKNAKK